VRVLVIFASVAVAVGTLADADWTEAMAWLLVAMWIAISKNASRPDPTHGRRE